MKTKILAQPKQLIFMPNGYEKKKNQNQKQYTRIENQGKHSHIPKSFKFQVSFRLQKHTEYDL